MTLYSQMWGETEKSGTMLDTQTFIIEKHLGGKPELDYGENSQKFSECANNRQ